MKIIIENQYFAPIYLYSILTKSTHIIFDQYDFHRKMSFRNRCILAASSGIVSLSIPLSGGRQQKVIAKEVLLENRYNWQKQHLKTIESSYRRAPWFEYFYPDLEILYQKVYSHLSDWDIDLFKWIIDKIGMKIQISFTEEFRKKYDKEEYIDLRDQLFPRNYSSFRSPMYHQVFMEQTGFLPNLSILDLLFCEGKYALDKLSSFS